MVTKHFLLMALLTLHATDACEHEIWNGDGFCDDFNNNENCGWDGGDCCGDVDVSTCNFCECLDPEYSNQTSDSFRCTGLWIGDRHCDDDFNNEKCGWDGGDCCGENVYTDHCEKCECLNPSQNGEKWDKCKECECLDLNYDGGFHSDNESIIGACGYPYGYYDNICNDENNNEECNWDGGDCCSNFDDICFSKCYSDVHKCCQIKDLEFPTSGFGPPASRFGYHDVFCKPRVDELTGCELFCDPVCEKSQVQCSGGCGHPDYCKNIEDSFTDLNCQHNLYDTSIVEYDNFKKNCRENGGESFGKDKVCVPHQYTYTIKLLPKPPQNEISITLSRVQITEIGDKLGQLTLIMDLEVQWKDDRMQLVKEQVPIFLSNEDQNNIWSPLYRIGTDLISHNKQGDDEVVLMKEYVNNQSYVISVQKMTYLSATFKCEMDFRNFPFDKHNCTFEVSTYNLNSIIFKNDSSVRSRVYRNGCIRTRVLTV